MKTNGHGNRNGRHLPPVITVSTLPGRLRIRASAIRDQPMLATRLEHRLAAHGAVQRVSTSALTGGVLVLFDPGATVPRRLLADIRRYLAEGAAGNGHPPAAAPWHAAPTPRVVTRLRTSRERGLSSAEAARRLAEFGANRLPAPQPKSSAEIVTGHLTSLPVALLGGAAALSLAAGALVDAAVILGVVAANTVVGYLTESRVERTIAALADTAPPQAVVRRDGREIVAPAAALVPGDVLVLRSGAEVVADARILEASGLAMDQSALTGESQPVPRSAAPVAAAAVAAERDSMVFAGTRVVEGRGLAVVTATGLQTEIGGVRALIAETRSPATPLERQLDAVGRTLVGVSLGLCGLTLGLGWLRGVPLLEMTRSAISLAVAAVPEGLPAVATTTLALGMQRMMKQGMLVRRLSAVESLGATTVVCADKTGTLTENRMSVESWYLDGRECGNGDVAALARDPVLARALRIGVLCNEADLGGGNEVLGSSTEGALLLAALEAGIDYRTERASHPLLRVRERGNGANWMATVHGWGRGRRLVAVKGAPEQVVRLADRWFDGAEEHPLDEERRREVLHANARMAARGLRVLALAYRKDDGTGEPAFRDLVCVGLVGLTDPVRPGVRQAIDALRRAGIRTVILTGDQAATAAAVSRELDLFRDGPPRILEAGQLVGVHGEDLRRLVRKVDVFARVSPAHKYHVVRAFQAGGEIVAMTGDGINDAAALRAADVGVAMGAGGTDLAREVADVVLVNDDLGAIVKAVEQGRSIRSNIGRSLRFLLATNLSEILVTLGALTLGGARPLSAIQFLWINLMSDVAPALALALEPADPGVMSRPPDDPSKALLSRGVLAEIGIDAGVLAAGALAAHGIAAARYGVGPRASTVAFSTLTSAQLLQALVYRSRRGATGAPSPLLTGVVGGSLLFQASTLLVPAFRRLLGLAVPSAADWALIAGSALAPVLINEIRGARRSPVPTSIRSATAEEESNPWQ
jgi:Ca2+-transporting ATPase